MCAVVAALAVGPLSPARSQERPGPPDSAVPEHPAELEEWIQSELRKLRNSPFSRRPESSDVWVTVTQLLARNHPSADAGLAALVRDSDTASPVVERIVVATLVDHEGDYRLLGAVIDRLLQERGSTFDGRFDDPIRRHASAPLIRRLAGFALDSKRRRTFRVEAARMLGRTRKPEALDYLVRIWDSADPEIARSAKEAFERVLPAGFETRAEAVAALDDMHEQGLDYWDLQNELLRNRTRPAPVVIGDKSKEYVALALAVADQVTLDVLLDNYLTSSVRVIRQRGARRLAAFPYDEIEQAAARIEARLRVGRACLSALAAEEDEESRSALFDPLEVLVDYLHGSGEPIPPEELRAVVACIDLSKPADQELRRRAIQFLGKLADARALEPLKRTFERLEDSNKELRDALLTALDSIAGQELVAWLIDKVGDEKNHEIAGTMIQLLGKSEDAAAVEPLARLLAGHDSDGVRFKAVLQLGTLWRTEEFRDAREALLRYGLQDVSPGVRQSAAEALDKPGLTAEGDARVVHSLSALAADDEIAEVRLKAAVAVLKLDERGAVRHLLPAFSDTAIWETFRDRVADDAGQRSQADWAFQAADHLLAQSESAQQELALDLLAAVARAREGSGGGAPLWNNGGEGLVRGLVRERLATLLLARNRGEDAALWLTELVEPATERSAQDPRDRWLIQLAEALRKQGGAERLARAREYLAEVRAMKDLDPARPADALLELARNLLASGDAETALEVLSPDQTTRAADYEALEGSVERGGEIGALRAELRRALEAQNRRISELIDSSFGEPPKIEDREQLLAMGAPATRYVERELQRPGNLSRALRLLEAASLLTGQSFAVDVTPETKLPDLGALVEDARKALHGAARAE